MLQLQRLQYLIERYCKLVHELYVHRLYTSKTKVGMVVIGG